MAFVICKCIIIITERAAGRMGLGYVSQGAGLLITHNVEILTSQEKQQRNIFWSQAIPTFNPVNTN